MHIILLEEYGALQPRDVLQQPADQVCNEDERWKNSVQPLPRQVDAG